jgi:hypothetical protein
MSVKFSLTCAVVFAVGTLLFSGNAFAQFGGQVKVSNVIEGGIGGVSTARCGNTIVVGFADAESTRPNSYDGVASSTNGGLSFADRGTLPVPPPDPILGPYILGSNFNDPAGQSNPAVACANSSLFYYASMFITPGEECFNPGDRCTTISVSKSSDGGNTWSLPVIAALQGADVFDFVSPSIAVDPTNPARLYVAYIDVNMTSFFFTDCFGTSASLDIVKSVDGGKTWTQPLRVDHACPGASSNPRSTGTLATPNIIVSPGGKVYVAYEFAATEFNGVIASNEIRFTRSLDGGKTFSAPITVSNDAINNALPQLAVDRTTSSFRGTIYLTWSGKPRGTTTEVLMSDSLNFGVSFSFPRSVRGTSQGTQINPVVAVDNDGQVADCYYVTGTNNPASSSTYFYNCLTSFNHAATWAGYQKLVPVAPPGVDALTSDFLLRTDGFFTAFELTSAGRNHVVGEKSDVAPD